MQQTHRMGARDIVLIAVFAGITAALGLIPPIILPISPVPITAQTLGVMLAGAILGPLRGAASQALVLALVAMGLPLLAGGRGGLGTFAGPTVGFMIAWVVAAGLIGALTYKFGQPYAVWQGILWHVVFGIVVMYVFGIAGMMAVGRLTLMQAILGNIPFLIGDSIKAVLAAFIAKGVHSAYPKLLPAGLNSRSSETRGRQVPAASDRSTTSAAVPPQSRA